MVIDPLYPFVFLGLFSPGPNVILLTTSGARFGLRRTAPHLFGVVVGVGVTSGLTALGIGAALETLPALEMVLKCVAALWIAYMAYGLWHTDPMTVDPNDRPMKFHEAVLFQWVNPKVWAVALAAVSGYGSDLSPLFEALRLSSAFSGLNLGVCLFWASTGAILTYLLSSPQVWRLFNRVMALALLSFSVIIFL